MKTYQRMKYIVSVILLNTIISITMTAQSLYFSSPQESVEITSKILIEEDWETLSNYYFTANSDKETIDSMKTGTYFIRDKRPEVSHPSESWRYKKPFSPNFKYLSHFETEENIIKVTVSIEIDQGMGIPSVDLHLRGTVLAYGRLRIDCLHTRFITGITTWADTTLRYVK